MDVSAGDRDRIVMHCRRGSELLGEGELDASEREYLAALQIDDRVHEAWFDLGLISKRRRDWEPMLERNRQAAATNFSNEEPDPSWWNFAIAATALGRWEDARTGWASYGIDLPAGAGPINGNYGVTPVRIGPVGAGEVVWCDRIDPCRAVIRNVPLAESGHRWMDVVLHDGEPNGERVVNGNTYPVFDELARLEDSGISTLGVAIRSEDPDGPDDLMNRCRDAGIGAENWNTSLRILCAACSAGVVGDTTDHEHEQIEALNMGLAGGLAEAEAVLDAWRAGSSETRAYADLQLIW